MKVTILNLLNPSDTRTELLLKGAVNAYQNDFPKGEIIVKTVDTDAIKDCIGCWSCWVKTPGRCVFNDQMSDVYPAILNSDKVLFMLPTTQGFVSGSGKTFIDRLIPLYHPYIDLYHGEMMHYERYEKYPEFEFFVDTKGLTSEQEAVLEDYFYRTAYHFRQEGVRLVETPKVEGSSSCLMTRKSLEPREPKGDMLTDEQKTQQGKYIVYNGSQRGLKGNSHKIAKQIVEGLKLAGVKESDIELRHLVNQSSHLAWAEDFYNNSHHLFVMPLYVHSMPGIVKKYFDLLPKKMDSTGFKPQLSFFIQSGFNGGYQSYFLRAILSRLPQTINCLYGGTVICAGMEALQVQPDQANTKLYLKLQQLGQAYVNEGKFANSASKELESKPYLSNALKIAFYLLKPTGILNLYWNMQMKKNNAYSLNFDRPYSPK